jgi:hypothetical protein
MDRTKGCSWPCCQVIASPKVYGWHTYVLCNELAAWRKYLWWGRSHIHRVYLTSNWLISVFLCEPDVKKSGITIDGAELPRHLRLSIAWSVK